MELLQPELGDVSMWEAASVDEVFGLLFGEEEMGMNPGSFTTMGMNPQGSSDPSSGHEMGGLYPLFQSWQQQDEPIGQPPAEGSQQGSQQHLGGRLVTTQMAPLANTSQSDMGSAGSRTMAPNAEFCSISSASLPSHSSSGAPGSEGLFTQTSAPADRGWQSLMDGLDEVPAALQAAPAKRGRKPAAGGTAKKPVKDKKRENTLLIRQLEAEMMAKLNIVGGVLAACHDMAVEVKQLEGQNTELKRKERLLQLSVDTSENNMSRLVDPQLGTNLRDMLQSFRGMYNRSAAEVALAKIAHVKDPKDMTFEIFSKCWQAITAEMCDSLMADAIASTPTAKQAAEEKLKTLSTRAIDFVLALCWDKGDLILQAIAVNLVTGEPNNTDSSFWEGVIDKMNLTDEQMRDLAGACDMHSRCKARNWSERALIKQELAAVVAAEEAWYKTGVGKEGYSIKEVMDRLSTNVMRGGTFDNLASFLALRIMTPRQACQMVMHSSPGFPSLFRIMVLVNERALARGLLRRAT